MYMTDGLVVAVDLSNLGGLVMLRISPQLSISRPGRDYDDVINLNLVSGPRASSEMDLTELIAPYLQGVRRIDYQPPAENLYLFAGDNGMGRIVFRTKDSESPLPIKALKLYRINNKDLWFDAEIDSPGKMDHVSITPQEVAKAGIPIRAGDASDAVSLPLFTENHDLPPRYLAASKVLRSLIPKEMLVPEDAEQQKGTN